MVDPDSESYLTGQVLIAMPEMNDPRFEKSVIYLCTHSEEGAMGLIVNKSLPNTTLHDLLDQTGIAATGEAPPDPIYFGGPVERARGFVLHGPDYRSDIATLEINSAFRLTATQDILEAMSAGTGPGNAILTLGYSGWGPGQLEGEIARNGWLSCPADPELVFDTDEAKKWVEALARLGIDPLLLSSEAGHA